MSFNIFNKMNFLLKILKKMSRGGTYQISSIFEKFNYIIIDFCIRLFMS